MDPTGAEDPAGDALAGGAGGATGERTRGSLFDLLLAARRGERMAPAAASVPSGRAGAGRPGTQVLVVAGSERRRASLRARLEAGGFATAEAADAASAVALADTARPAVAVIDVRLPDQGGFEIARQFGRVHPATRVVLHASVVTSTAITAARQVGAFALVIEHAAEGCLVEFVRAATPDQPSPHQASLDQATLDQLSPDRLSSRLSSHPAYSAERGNPLD
jgi:DNA-binding NarL/FixJ family response regulator